MARLAGCDISKWQGIVDFESLKSVADFVIARASYGNGYTDAQFSRNRNELRRLNVLRGFYHYAYPTYNAPETEADWFCQVISPLQSGELACLDFEENYNDPVGWCLRFLDRLSDRLGGYKPLIYINKSLANSCNWKPVIDKDYGLWLAYWDYNSESTKFSVPWSTVALRQWSNRESFPGISGGVDANIFYGDKVSYLAYGYKAPTAPTQEEQWAKSQVIKDSYTFLCGGFSEDEIAWRVNSKRNLVEIGDDICSGDVRFFEKWVKPKIPVVVPAPVSIPEPPSNIGICPEADILRQIHDVLYSKGWWWVRWFKIRELLPK